MIIRSDEYEDLPVPGLGAMRIHIFRPAIEGRFPGVLIGLKIKTETIVFCKRNKGRFWRLVIRSA